MPAVQLPNGRTQFCDANGAPYAGGSIAHYVPSTLTPKTTWTDPTEAVANPTIIALDGAGRASIWGDGLYRQILKDSSGATVWDVVSEALTVTTVASLLTPFTGDSGAGGAQGEVPAPAAGSAALGQYLSANGTFQGLQVVLPAALLANQAGFLGAPQRIISASSALVLSDAGGNILHSNAAAHNLTITNDATIAWPANVVTLVTVNNPSGSGVLSLVPDTGVTLLGPGAFPSSGTRALAANGQVVLARIAANSWTVVGAGLS